MYFYYKMELLNNLETLLGHSRDFIVRSPQLPVPYTRNTDVP